MKIADFNNLRHDIFSEAAKLPEVSDALRLNNIVYIYEVTDGKQQHGVLVLSAKTQLNDNTLAQNGFDAATARAHLVLTLNRNTKCATF